LGEVVDFVRMAFITLGDGQPPLEFWHVSVG
jgi:hypothetical protein